MGFVSKQEENVSDVRSSISRFREWFSCWARSYKQIFYGEKAKVSSFCVGDRVRIVNIAEGHIYECPFPLGSEFFIVEAFLSDQGIVYLLCKYRQIARDLVNINIHGFDTPLLPAVDWMLQRVDDPETMLLKKIVSKLS